MTRSRREILLSAAFALWGLALAISLASVWMKPAPPGQLAGYATTLGFDARAPFRWIAGMIVLPLIVPLIFRPLIRRLADSTSWAVNTILIAPLVLLWFVTISRAPLWVLVPFAMVVAICTLLRHRELAFTRYDVVLVPTLLAVLLGVNDAFASLSIDRVLLVGLLIVFALRVAVALVPRDLPPALAFIAAPLGLVLQTGFFSRDQRYFGWHALAVAVITPFVIRVFLRNARRAIAMLVLVTYPLSMAAYINATSITTAEGKQRVNVFEDSHNLLPASEMLGGELPYRDIVPTHGLIEDGLLDYLILKARGVTVGTSWKTRNALSVLNVFAIYALAWALSGSPAAAFLALLLALLTNTYATTLRWLPAIVALALICWAVRRRNVQWLRYGAIATVFAGATSLDFGAYAFLTLIVAVLRFPGDRRKAFRGAAIGILIAVVPLFAGFAFLGILDDFFRTTFIELLTLGPVYTLNLFEPSAAMPRTFPEALVGVFTAEGFLYVIWCVAAVIAGVMLARGRTRRFEPIVLVAFFMTIAALSYGERHHLYFRVVAAPFAIALAYLVIRKRPSLAPALVLAFLILAAPTTHLGITGWIRDARGPVEPQWVEVPEIPRARGALFLDQDAAALRGMAKYVSIALKPDETWLDFSNRGIFYFLLRRDCPIRQPEVAFYQTDERQRDVIRRLETDPRIRAVLLSGPSGRYIVDGVPNEHRAPLVWQYIEANFVPDYEEGDVRVWRRK